MEKRLEDLSQSAPSFSAALRGYREALGKGDTAIAEGLMAWVSGQPNVGASLKRAANLKGEVDHFAALSFLQGLLVVLRDSGHGAWSSFRMKSKRFSVSGLTRAKRRSMRYAS